jgi:hypothetical protein
VPFLLFFCWRNTICNGKLELLKNTLFSQNFQKRAPIWVTNTRLCNFF